MVKKQTMILDQLLKVQVLCSSLFLLFELYKLDICLLPFHQSWPAIYVPLDSNPELPYVTSEGLSFISFHLSLKTTGYRF